MAKPDKPEEETEAHYEPSSAQVDLERRLEKDNQSERFLSTAPDAPPVEDDGKARDMKVEGNEVDDYLGTAVEYQNYSSDVFKPGRAEEGPEAQLEEQLYTAATETEEHRMEVAPPPPDPPPEPPPSEPPPAPPVE